MNICNYEFGLELPRLVFLKLNRMYLTRSSHGRTSTLNLALARFLTLAKNNCAKITDGQGEREINRVEDLRNEDMPDGYAECKVECTSGL
jgi:hypothetical protein